MSVGDFSDARARVIGLVDRLTALDARIHDLERSKNDLQQRLYAAQQGNALRSPDTEESGTHYAWPLAEDGQRTAEMLLPHEMRVDDPVIGEMRRGEAFLARFGLLRNEQDMAGAAVALEAMPCRPSAAGTDVSIILHVGGRLNLAVNTLESLLAHESRYGFEVILMDDQPHAISETHFAQSAGIRWHATRTGPENSAGGGMPIVYGRFVLLLENGARLVGGALDALVESFVRWPGAGLVGGKLFGDKGGLLQAGGIVWRDGSLCDYGSGEDPNAPQYAYARQVDFVSAAVMLPAALWNQLGLLGNGFDREGAEIDLAFQVRAAGFEVWVQPQARILCYTAREKAAYSGEIFLLWRTQLSRHRPRGEMPHLERERGVHQRFLVVDLKTPAPDEDAGSVQTFLALQVCMALGYKTHFVPLGDWRFRSAYTEALQRMGVECAYAPYEDGFEAFMQRHGDRFDVVMVYRPSVMEACLPVIRAFAPHAAVLFHVADLHYLRLERSAALAGDEDLAAAAALMKQRELKLIGQADCTITHSGVEQNILAREAPGCPVALWPLMAEAVGTQVSFDRRRDICFLGNFGHAPNIDAVLYFLAEIFPLLRVRASGIRVIIAGPHPPDEILALAAEDILVTGKVDELRTLFDACRVFVCPLRVGAGVKGKVASALSYGIPVVSTSMGIEGAGLTHELNVLVADAPGQFADAIMRLYQDEVLWNRLSENGQVFIQAEGSLEMGQRVLRQAIETAFEQKITLRT